MIPSNFSDPQESRPGLQGPSPATSSSSRFNTSLRRHASEPRDLIARVDAEVRDRIAEAVDSVCLGVMVESRRARGLPAPAPDSAHDRAEFNTDVETFLTRLGDKIISATLGEDQRRALALTVERTGQDRLTRLLAIQVSLAKLLPDYWQRFETVRAAHESGWSVGPTSTSGGDRSGWLGRLGRLLSG